MNLDANPTVQQLRELIARYDDAAGNHVLWVKRTGEVEISTVPPDNSPGRFQQEHPEMRLRYGPFLAGNEYVGPEAAADDEWIAELFESLLREWRKAKGESGVVAIDRF
jgi:hypothetical protein